MTLAQVIPGMARETPDTAAIKTIVESVATLADSRNFESLEKLYGDKVAVDYTSLTGGKPETKTAQTLMTEWAAVLPGFDRTRHAISNVKVDVTGSEATATADVVADHFLGSLFWQVSGNYLYRLRRDEDGWKIMAHRFNLTNEVGSRDIFAPAMAAAKAKPVSYLARQQGQQVVRDFLTALEEKDMAKFANVWTEDAVQDMPYSPDGFPKRVAGKANLVTHYSGWPQNSGKANFTKELVFYPTQDASVVIAEYHGIVDIVPTKRVYDQRYMGVFKIEGGKIKLFREYYDPIVFKHAFGLGEGGAFQR